MGNRELAFARVCSICKRAHETMYRVVVVVVEEKVVVVVMGGEGGNTFAFA